MSIKKTIIVPLSIFLLVTTQAVAAGKKSVTGFARFQEVKTAIEVPVFSTPFTGIISPNLSKCGFKFEYELAKMGNGAAKWKTELTLSDISWLANVIRAYVVNSSLATNTNLGEKFALVSSYLLMMKPDIRQKIKELRAVKETEVLTLEERRAQVSRMLIIKSEIDDLLKQQEPAAE